MNRVEGLTVCVNHADYLEHTIESSKQAFDRFLVVTDNDDIETKKLCDYFFVECFQTDAFYLKGAKFNKGNAIEAALGHMDFQGWTVHHDCDIVLPPKTGSILKNLNLNEQCIYGVDRMMCPSGAAWYQFKKARLPQHELAYVHTGPFPLGVRIAKMDQGGYIPIGYFQMFHRSAAPLQKRPWYPTQFPDASTSDEVFGLKWDRAHRNLLPEIIAYHLDTDEQKQMGANWNGRKTKRFEVTEPASFGSHVRPIPKL